MTRLTCLLEPTSEARRRGYPTGREEQCAAARHLRPPAAAAAAAAAVEEDDDEVTGLSSTVHWAVGPLRGWLEASGLRLMGHRRARPARPIKRPGTLERLVSARV